MRLKDLFGRRPPPPSPRVQPDFAMALQPAPRFTPLPALADTPQDAAVAHAWLAFQQTNPDATWPAFIRFLEADNARLAKEITDLTNDIAWLS